MFCPVYQTQLVRSRSIRYRGKVNSTKAACQIVGDLLADSPNEKLCVVMLDSRTHGLYAPLWMLQSIPLSTLELDGTGVPPTHHAS